MGPLMAVYYIVHGADCASAMFVRCRPLRTGLDLIEWTVLVRQRRVVECATSNHCCAADCSKSLLLAV